MTEDGKVLNGRCLICHPLGLDEIQSMLLGDYGGRAAAEGGYHGQQGHQYQYQREGGNRSIVLTAQVEIASEKDLRRANSSTKSGLTSSNMNMSSARMTDTRNGSNSSISGSGSGSGSSRGLEQRRSSEPLRSSRQQIYRSPSDSQVVDNRMAGAAESSMEDANTASVQPESLNSPSQSHSHSMDKNEITRSGRHEIIHSSSALAMASNGQLPRIMRNRRTTRLSKNDLLSTSQPRLEVPSEGVEVDAEEEEEVGTDADVVAGTGTEYARTDNTMIHISNNPSGKENSNGNGVDSDSSTGNDNDTADSNENMDSIARLEQDSISIKTVLEIAGHGQNTHTLEVKHHAAHSLCRLICNTKLTADDLNRIVNEGGIKLLIDAINGNYTSMGSSSNTGPSTNNGTNEALEMSIFSAISVIGADKRVQAAIANEDGMVAIVKLMDKVTIDQSTMALIMECIGVLCENRNNADSLVRAAGPIKIIDVMTRFGESADIQQTCINTIIKLSRVESLQRSLLVANGAGQISIVMIMFSSDIHLLQLAMRGLRSLGSGSSSNKHAIVNTGAIDSIVAAMQIHRNDPAIQAASARTLGDLSISTEAAKQIGECGGIDVLTRALYVHIENLDVTRRACRALELLSKCSHNHLLMVNIGVVKAVLSVMQYQSDTAPIISSCLAILSNLAKDGRKTAILIVENEALDFISMSMVMHSEDRSLQKHACSVLANLICDATLDSLLAIGVNELMASAVQKFPSECKGNVDKVLATIIQLS